MVNDRHRCPTRLMPVIGYSALLPPGSPSRISVRCSVVGLGARLQEPSLLVPDYLGKWRLRGVKRPPQKEATESSHREPRPARTPGLCCFLNTRPAGKAKP